MDHRPRFSSLSSSYNEFLFAPVCDEANGMRLSVLSALARMNVDPWEEATRLAAMPKAIAERTLISILDLAAGRNWNPPEAQAIAARLVRLLPDPGQAATKATAQTGKAPTQPTNYWWLWVGFALAMSFMTPQHKATTNPSMAQTEANLRAPITSAPAPLKTNAPAPLKSNNLVPDAVGQSR